MPLATRDATVTWTGTLASGRGELSTGALSGGLPMDWASRSEQAEGTTSPEELLAAAHAACYAMTLSLLLGREGHKAERLEVHGTCELDRREDEVPEYVISRLRLQVTADVPGLQEDAFRELAERADADCAITAALRPGVGAVELDASLGG